MEKLNTYSVTEYNSFIINCHIFEQTIFTLYNTQKLFFNTSENENLELYKNWGRSAMLQIFPPGKMCNERGRICNVADLPGGGRSLPANC